MPRPLSPTALAGAMSQQTDEVYLVLLTIQHQTGAVYLTSDSVITTSNGNTFLPLPFDITLPKMEESQASSATLTIDNVDRQIIAELRTQPIAMMVQIDVIVASEPDTILVSFPDFSLRSVSYNAMTITGQLTMEAFLMEPFPKDRMTSQYFPGLFFR